MNLKKRLKVKLIILPLLFLKYKETNFDLNDDKISGTIEITYGESDTLKITVSGLKEMAT